MTTGLGSERRGMASTPTTRPGPSRGRSRIRTDRSALVAIVLLVVSLLLMTFDVRSSSEGLGATFRNGAQFVAAPLQAGINAVVTPVVGFADGLANLAGLRQENERLRERITELEGELILVGHLEDQVEELSVLLGMRLEGDLQELAIAAEVTGRAGNLDSTLFINRGTDDGVHQGQPVVDGRGALVGVVSEAGERSSVVTPITSRRSPAVTVRLADNRRGIVEGLGTGGLQLSILDADAPVVEGELLTTFGPFGESDAYPKGLYVGTAIESASPQSGVIRVDVEPVGDLERVEYVGVIPWPPSPDQLAEDARRGTIPSDAAENSDAADGQPTGTGP